MWRFAIRDALDGARGGGIAGLVGRAVAYLADGRAAERMIAEHALRSLDRARPGRVPGAAAQVAAGLRSRLGEPVGSAPAPQDGEGPWAVRSAGIALVAPFLPMLFERLELTGDGRFLSAEAEERAIRVLEAVVHGSDAPPMGGQRLERLLCGVAWDRRLGPPLPPDAEALNLIDGLLASVIARWSAIGSTSVAGLREAFLQRDGLLRRIEAGWTLEVQPRPYDMLLDRLPWSVAVLKLAWMPAPIHVKWRN